MLRFGLLVFLASYLGIASAAFGVTSSGGRYIVDAGSPNPLVIKVDMQYPSSDHLSNINIYEVNQANCDITSLVYRGNEYQYQSTFSHIGSGLGSATVSATVPWFSNISHPTGQYVKITCVTSTLTHYYVVKSGGMYLSASTLLFYLKLLLDSTVYMATYITAQPSVGELRYIARLNRSFLPNGDPESYTDLGSETVEGSDVFRQSNGQTVSKFYSSERFIDDKVHYVSGNDVIISMVIPDPTSYEGSAGGPFFRDINRDRGSSYHALYWYMNSGHAQTETKRIGLMGPYAMVFSRSGVPSGNLDVSFFSQLGISGYVGTGGRGTVTGTASGVSTSYQRVVHWFNDVAPPMKAGTYTMVLYRDEFEIARKSVSVGAGSTVSSSIASNEATAAPAWRIGEFNGRPTGFRNADLQEHMHPSDVRMNSWGPDVNNPTTIKFTLNSGQTGAATLKIGTTLAFAGGRPQVTVNGWAGPIPPTPTDSQIYDAIELITTGSSSSPTTTTTTVAQPTATSGTGTVPLYGQCGGNGYTGPTVCAQGTCTYSNEWVQQEELGFVNHHHKPAPLHLPLMNSSANADLPPPYDFTDDDRHSMEDESRPLPKGWVRDYDHACVFPQSLIHHEPYSCVIRRNRNKHHFYVDTKTNPPRSIWVHPFEDEQFQREHPELFKQSRPPPSRPGENAVAGPSNTEGGTPEKKGFIQKMKDKAAEHAAKKEEERKQREQLQRLSNAMSCADSNCYNRGSNSNSNIRTDRGRSTVHLIPTDTVGIHLQELHMGAAGEAVIWPYHLWVVLPGVCYLEACLTETVIMETALAMAILEETWEEDSISNKPIGC
ncbi:rhamnogalacturonase B [Rhizoctonia solani AG-1 IA]|uniref:Rhamnogalacturonase B n=1 Tax=Thanatephorus cucumeris (strain AG1-IA) TaxID=983506 RepID=L8X742_THACA|nr:rhamnogalacturonase B [Rhizoctonia solani AG-1 IA]